MRKLLAIALCLATPGCAAVGAVGAVAEIADGISTHGDTVILSGTKGLAIAADAYATAANLAAAAIRADTPHLADDQLRLVRTLNDQAAKLLSGADTSLSLASRAASLSLIVTQLHSIIGK